MYKVELMCGISNVYNSGREQKGRDTNTVSVELTLTTAGGNIVCRRCNATSKRTRVQCGAPAMQGKTKCKTHGGMSTGPRTKQGKLRCAQAKTIHGNETRADRQIHRLAMKRLRLCAQILGVPFRTDAGDKRL